MASISIIEKDIVIRFKGDLYVVVEFQHVNPGKGAAFVRARLKNISTGKVFENTFKASEAIEVVEVDRKKMQYLYHAGDDFTFMDGATYEQVTLNRALLGERAGFLKEGQEVTMLLHEGVPVSVTLPKKVTLKVVEAEPAVRGDSASGSVTKEIKLETGLTLRAPLFIKEGEMIVVNTETGEYVERA